MNIIRKYKISKILNKPLDGIEGEIVSFMKSITDDLIPFKHDDYPDSIFYMNSKGEWVFEQNNKNDGFWVRYSIVWEVLETKYFMENSNIEEFIKYLIEEAFKQKVSTPSLGLATPISLIEEAFKKFCN